jgi:hypothetical protein
MLLVNSRILDYPEVILVVCRWALGGLPEKYPDLTPPIDVVPGLNPKTETAS